MQLVFQTNAWDDYVYWQQTDKDKLRRINDLIKDCMRDPFKGIGKPEPLKNEFSGCWSRRIDNEHRLVYAIRENRLHIIQCRFHYGK